MLNSEERCCKYPTKMHFIVIWGIIFNISLFYMDHSLRRTCIAGPLHCRDLRAKEESVNPKWSWFSACDNLFRQPLPCPHRRRFQDKYFSGQWPKTSGLTTDYSLIWPFLTGPDPKHRFWGALGQPQSVKPPGLNWRLFSIGREIRTMPKTRCLSSATLTALRATVPCHLHNHVT